MNTKFADAFQRGLRKVDHMQRELHGAFPHITKKGKWRTNQNGHWTGGFWTGLLWLKALSAPEDQRQQEMAAASVQARKLAVRMSDDRTHDMGFIFGPSCVLGDRIQPDARLVEMAITGARNMTHLYRKEIGLVLAWDEPGYEGVAIVDTIMNVPLMVWAADREPNPALHDTAISIADHIRTLHVRPDGSTYHVVRWDPKSHEIVERATHQGFSEESCWSRGQAWALYGFANMYRYTSREGYLETSRHLAEYHWEYLDDGLCLPRWDFIFRNDSREPLDAAAGSIAASGMLLLSKMLERNGHVGESALWKERGESILDALVEHCFYRNLEEYGLIEHVTVDRPRNSGVDESSMYGDYYFMEALYRAMNHSDDQALDILY